MEFKDKHKHSHRGQRGAIAAPKIIMPKNTFLIKMSQISFFSIQNPAREAYSGHSGVRNVPPPKRSAPPRQISGYNHKGNGISTRPHRGVARNLFRRGTKPGDWRQATGPHHQDT